MNIKKITVTFQINNQLEVRSLWSDRLHETINFYLEKGQRPTINKIVDGWSKP